MIRVLVNGAHGKMGQATVAAVQQDTRLTLVGAAGREDDLVSMIASTQAQVVVDFTLATVAFDNAQRIIEAGARPVIGTSGLNTEQVATLSQHCAHKKLGGIIAPNFSIGAVLMMRYAQAAARYFTEVEIVEMHHPRKLDAPSGTALRTAELIAQAQPHLTHRQSQGVGMTESRGANHQGVPIHALRLSGVIANQSVIFGGQGETLTIQHNTLSREAFMPGVCLACVGVMGLDGLVYGLEHLLSPT